MRALGNAQASANNYLQHHGLPLFTNLTSQSTHFPSNLHLRTSSYLLHINLNILNCRNPEVSQKSLQTSSHHPVKNSCALGQANMPLLPTHPGRAHELWAKRVVTGSQSIRFGVPDSPWQSPIPRAAVTSAATYCVGEALPGGPEGLLSS